MGTKIVGRKGQDKEKMNSVNESLSSEDEKKKTKRNEANGDDVEVSAIEIEAVNCGGGLYDHDIAKKKERKKKKKKKHDGLEGNGCEQVQKMGGLDDYETTKKKKKKHKKRKLAEAMDETPNNEIIEEDTGNIDLAGNQVGDGELEAQALKAANKKDEKKRKKRKREKDGGNTGVTNDGGIDGKDVRNEMECLDGNIMKKVEYSKKEKKKKKEKKHGGLEGNGSEKKQKVGGDVEPSDSLEKSTPRGTSKRVSFSEDVVVFPSSDGPSDEETSEKKELVRGKRFSRKEDEMVKAAVWNYINAHALGAEEGLKMVLQCKKYPAVKNCWKEIGAALPWRPCESVYYRAHILFQRGDKHTWSAEELELVRNFHEEHGSDWKTLAEELGKHRFHVKDAWRRIKLANPNKGKWSQEEYQNLFDLVNMDLRMKALEEVKKTKHGMLRDNICWTAISDKLGTRATAICCLKWYNQLASPMVAEGKWHDVDDYRLIIALYDLDACCMEDVDWDSLLEHRSGDVCRKRWNQMVKHLGEIGNKSFADQVEALMNRYCPDVLEAREAYNSKPEIP